MVITDREISILRDVPGSDVIRCGDCEELIVAECIDGYWDMDEERDTWITRIFAPCPNCDAAIPELTEQRG